MDKTTLKDNVLISCDKLEEVLFDELNWSQADLLNARTHFDSKTTETMYRLHNKLQEAYDIVLILKNELERS